MIDILISAERPNRLEEGLVKDKKYDARFAKYGIGKSFGTDHNNWISQIFINRNFWAGNQWIFNEDLEAFLKDDSGQVRNRIKYIRNFIRGQVAQYTGNAINMDMTIMAKSLSYNAINRREEKLSELLFYTDLVGRVSEGYGEFLKKNIPIGDTEEETVDIFENIWVDEYEETINKLLMYVSDKEKFNQLRGEISLDLCLSGIALLKYDIWNGDFIFDKIRPENFFFDRTAKRYDLTDCEYMGYYQEMTSSEIFEKYQVDDVEDRKAIEKHVSGNDVLANKRPHQTYDYNNKIPVYYFYYKDYERYEYGYVMDEFGYPYLTRINHIYEGDEKPRYTDKDLIKEKDLTEGQKKILKGKNKSFLYVDVIRYIEFIPSEILYGGSGSDKGKGRGSDIILLNGILPYQDTENYRISNVKFPIKCYCWEYDNGIIYTPITQLINPQRMINRLGSVAENITNNAMPPTLAYDKSLTDPQENEDMLRNIYQGKPIGLQTKGRGIHNAITPLNSTLDGTVGIYTSLIESSRLDMDRIIGVNESLRGESQGAEQLVGVTQLQIQRATLMQEPFYNALENVFLQAYQSIADVGKRVYIDNPRKLAIILGDKGSELIKLTEDYKLEDFRVFIKRQPSYQQQVMAGNVELINLYQLQLIDEITFADLYNRSTPDDIAKAVRKTAKDKAIVSKQMAAKQQEEAQRQEQLQLAMIEQEQQNKEIERIENLAENQKERDNRENVARIKAAGFGRKNV